MGNVQPVAIAVLAVVLLSGCASPGGDKAVAPRDPATLFAAALTEAAVTAPDRIGPDLWQPAATTPGLIWRDGTAGRQVLVASTMSAASYEKYYKDKTAGSSPSSWGVMWVTLVPQLQGLCQQAPGDAAAKTRRVVEYLGLNPASDYSQVVEFWVAPEALARPCPSPDTATAHCTLDDSSSASRPACAAGDTACAEQQSYWDWFARNMRLTYKQGGAPWTRLGYTFDWQVTADGGFRRYGASEFILRPSRPYDIKASYSLASYCASPGS